MEIKIPKEVRRHKETIFFGLSTRQFLCALLAVFAAVGVYFALKDTVGRETASWVCILAAFPFALGGFFQYNGMTLEQFLLAFFRSEFLTPKRLVFKSENMYAKLMAHSSVKEALNLD